MKKRSGEAQAAQHRPPVVHHHRLEPRGGARRSAYEEEVEPEPTDEEIRELYSDGLIHIDLKDLAMFGTKLEQSEARARCVEILAKMKK